MLPWRACDLVWRKYMMVGLKKQQPFPGLLAPFLHDQGQLVDKKIEQILLQNPSQNTIVG